MYTELEIILFILSVLFLGTFPLVLFHINDVVDSIEEKVKSLLKERIKKRIIMKISICKIPTEYGWWYILPSIEVKHKYWYLWQILLSWGKWCLGIDVCRKDWDKNRK